MDYQKKLNFIMEYTRLRISQSVPKFIYEGEALALIDEIERLRQQNERMKETLQNIALVLDEENPDYQKWALYCGDIANLCLEDIAKATGGE